MTSNCFRVQCSLFMVKCHVILIVWTKWKNVLSQYFLFHSENVINSWIYRVFVHLKSFRVAMEVKSVHGRFSISMLPWSRFSFYTFYKLCDLRRAILQSVDTTCNQWCSMLMKANSISPQKVSRCYREGGKLWWVILVLHLKVISSKKFALLAILINFEYRYGL